MARPFLILKTGSTIEPLRDAGDFEHWFIAGLATEHPVEVHDAVRRPPPSGRGFAGIIVTGSAAMVSDREAWSEDAAKWLAHQVHRQIPVLGVCYGHQLLAHALGGKVGANPAGRQIGTQPIQRLPAAHSDPLMAALPGAFYAQTTHLENVHRLPPGAVRLAHSPKDANHAFRFGQQAWGLQFHPEFDAMVMREYLQARRSAIVEEGLDHQRLLAGVKETPIAFGLIKRFGLLALAHSRQSAA